MPTFPISNSSITVNGDGSFVMTGNLSGATSPVPPTGEPPTPTPGNDTPQDAINIVEMGIADGSPDIRSWPITSKLTALKLSFGGNEGDNNVEFTKRWGPGSWPFVDDGGDIQYTLWVVVKRNGAWMANGSILCISRGQNDNYFPTGPILQPGQLPNNWYYYSTAMGNYQPAPGEQVGWFLTAGAQRRANLFVVAERTQIVLAPFSPGVFQF